MEKNIAKYQRVAFAYAKKNGFDTCLFAKEWKGYMAFSVSCKAEEGACIGFPAYALVDKKTMGVGIWRDLLFDDDEQRTPPVDLSSPEALDAWFEKYGDNG